MERERELVTYLLCLDAPSGSGKQHMRHYLGSTCNLLKRLGEHRNGQGAKCLAAAVRRGIPWSLVRTWAGVAVEKHLKQAHPAAHRFGARHSLKRYCPRCSPRPANVRLDTGTPI